jgi:hypothetical protein
MAFRPIPVSRSTSVTAQSDENQMPSRNSRAGFLHALATLMRSERLQMNSQETQHLWLSLCYQHLIPATRTQSLNLGTYDDFSLFLPIHFDKAVSICTAMLRQLGSICCLVSASQSWTRVTFSDPTRPDAPKFSIPV